MGGMLKLMIRVKVMLPMIVLTLLLPMIRVMLM